MSKGLSLAGFMDRDNALEHFRRDCVCEDESNGALEHQWKQARTRLGPDPLCRPGTPDIKKIPDEHADYIEQLKGREWVARQLSELGSFEFCLVEIDPLLAFQPVIDVARSDQHCTGYASADAQAIDMARLLKACLPLEPPREDFEIVPNQEETSVLVKTRCMNITLKTWGMIDEEEQIIGIQLGLVLPLLHVVQYRGRCYLHNGFHRALGFRGKGVTHLPCLYREVTDPGAIGLRRDGRTFTEQHFDDRNPPTLAHYTAKRALDVDLKSYTKVIHVSWTEHLVPNF